MRPTRQCGGRQNPQASVVNSYCRDGFDRIDFFAMSGVLSLQQRDDWEAHGFIVLKSFLSAELIEPMNRLVDRLWNDRRRKENPLVIDIFDGMPQSRRIFFKDAPDEAKRCPYKLNDLYLEYPQVRELVLDVKLMRVLHDVLEGVPMVCNTINFEFGPQQGDHFDTFYMPPRKVNRMVAAWIALEDVGQDAGPLRYYPGSHTIPPFLFSHGKTDAIPSEMPNFRKYISRELEQRGIEPVMFVAQKGDVLVWHAQLLHGGYPIQDRNRTRKTLVAHYFRAQDYYHRFWRLSRVRKDAYYYRRPHQPVIE
jgi:phytanoyl-CoA hydroxylase